MYVSDDVAENVMNERRGEVDRNPTLSCADEQCTNTTQAEDADGWLLHADPEIPVLCPECVERVPDNKQTPTKYQRDVNAQLTEWSE